MKKYDFDEPIRRRGTNCVKWDEAEADDVIPMWVADMDFRVAPAIQRAVEQRAAQGIYGYTIVPEAYYEAVINWFQRRHQWTIERPWMLYTTGVVPAVSAVIKAFADYLPLLDEGNGRTEKMGVLIQTPVYNCFFSSIRNNGCRIVESPLKYIAPDATHRTPRYEIDWDDFERKAAEKDVRLFLLCNPHNPAGRVWTKQELERMNDICLRHGVIVVSDEIHCELTYEQRYVPFASVSEACRDNSIVCSSPSKSFNTAGLQMANIVCKNDSWRRRIDRAINISEICDVNPFGPLGVMAAYNESEEWLDELCRYIKANYDALTEYLAQRLPMLQVVPLEGTYLAWIDISALHTTSDALTDRLLREGHVQVSSGTLYGATAGEGFIRLNLACPRSQLMAALQRIEQVVKQMATL